MQRPWPIKQELQSGHACGIAATAAANCDHLGPCIAPDGSPQGVGLAKCVDTPEFSCPQEVPGIRRMTLHAISQAFKARNSGC